MRLAILLALVILGSSNLNGQDFPIPELTEREFPAELRAQDKPVVKKPAAPQAMQKMLELRKLMEQPIDLVYDDLTWRDVEADIERKLGVNIVLTSSARDDALTEDEPISCSYENLAAKNAIRLMLRNENATFVIQDDVVKIISMDDAEDPRFFTTRFINVRSLLGRIKELEKDRIGQPRKGSVKTQPMSVVPIVGQLAENAKPAKTAAATIIAIPSNANSPVVELNTAESLLIDLTQMMVHRQAWEDDSELKILGGFAVVQASESRGDAVEDFFALLSYHLSKE